MLWGKVLRRKWSSIHYIVGVERNRFSIHQWRNRMLIFCSTSTFSKTCNKIQKQLLKLLYILLSYKVSYSSIEEMGRNMGCLQFGMPVFHLEIAIFHSGLKVLPTKETSAIKTGRRLSTKMQLMQLQSANSPERLGFPKLDCMGMHGQETEGRTE